MVELGQNQGAIDVWFERHTKGLTDQQKADLVIYMRAFDINEHYRQNWQGTGFKAQLVAPNKASALRYKAFLDELGEVSSEVVISPPDEREGFDEVDAEESGDEVVAFWQRMMKRYGSEEEYVKQIVNTFKFGDEPGDPDRGGQAADRLRRTAQHGALSHSPAEGSHPIASHCAGKPAV